MVAVMAQRTYGWAACGICGQRIKRSGLAMHSHIMKHVRAGELVHRSDAYTSQLGYLHMFKAPNETDDWLSPTGNYF